MNLLSGTLAFNSEMPEISFACQVQHPLQGMKLKLVQANSKREAINVAHLDGETRNKIFEVIECVAIGEEQFKDKTFRKEFDNTPI